MDRLTLAYTEVVGLRDQCKFLRRRADENAELQEDVKQLLAERSGLRDQVESAKSACHTLEEEIKKYFYQYMEIRAALTKVEKRTGFQSSKEEEPEVAEAISEVSPAAQGCRSAFENDSDGKSIASSSSYSMASTDDYLTCLCPLRLMHLITVLTTFSFLFPPSPPFMMPFRVACFDSDCTNFAFEVVLGSAFAHAVSVYASSHQHPSMSVIDRLSLVVVLVFPSPVLIGPPLALLSSLSTKHPKSGSSLWIWTM